MKLNIASSAIALAILSVTSISNAQMGSDSASIGALAGGNGMQTIPNGQVQRQAQTYYSAPITLSISAPVAAPPTLASCPSSTLPVKSQNYIQPPAQTPSGQSISFTNPRSAVHAGQYRFLCVGGVWASI